MRPRAQASPACVEQSVGVVWTQGDVLWSGRSKPAPCSHTGRPGRSDV